MSFGAWRRVWRPSSCVSHWRDLVRVVWVEGGSGEVMVVVLLPEIGEVECRCCGGRSIYFTILGVGQC